MVAWDSRQTREDWRSYRNAGLRWLAVSVVGLALVVGGVQLAVASSRALLTEGTATQGTVTAVGDGDVTFRYSADGETREQTLAVTSDRTYAVGDDVEVRYDPDDPEVARLVAEPRRIPLIGPAIVVLFLGAAFSAPVGLGVLLRARTWRRMLTRGSWQWARLQLPGRVVSLTVDGGEPVTGRLLAATRWRTKTLQALDGHELWMLADDRYILLTADGTNTLYGARRC